MRSFRTTNCTVRVSTSRAHLFGRYLPFMRQLQQRRWLYSKGSEGPRPAESDADASKDTLTPTPTLFGRGAPPDVSNTDALSTAQEGAITEDPSLRSGDSYSASGAIVHESFIKEDEFKKTLSVRKLPEMPIAPQAVAHRPHRLASIIQQEFEAMLRERAKEEAKSGSAHHAATLKEKKSEHEEAHLAGSKESPNSDTRAFPTAHSPPTRSDEDDNIRHEMTDAFVAEQSSQAPDVKQGININAPHADQRTACEMNPEEAFFALGALPRKSVIRNTIQREYCERPQYAVGQFSGSDSKIRQLLSDFDFKDHTATMQVIYTYPYLHWLHTIVAVALVWLLYEYQLRKRLIKKYDELLGLDLRMAPQLEPYVLLIVGGFFYRVFLSHPSALGVLLLQRFYRMLQGRPVGPP